MAVNLGSFLGDLKDEYGEDLQEANKSVGGAWSGPPLPANQEYRIRVVEGEWKTSNSGKENVVITWEIVEPEEFAGRRGRNYYGTDTSNQINKEQFAKLILATGVSTDNVRDDEEGWKEFASRFIDTTIVAPLRSWGDEDDQYSLRWVNKDTGQALKDNIKPAKKKTDLNALKPSSIGFAKSGSEQAEPFPDTTPATPVAPSVAADAGSTGIKLPPGLGG